MKPGANSRPYRIASTKSENLINDFNTAMLSVLPNTHLKVSPVKWNYKLMIGLTDKEATHELKVPTSTGDWFFWGNAKVVKGNDTFYINESKFRETQCKVS